MTILPSGDGSSIQSTCEFASLNWGFWIQTLSFSPLQNGITRQNTDRAKFLRGLFNNINSCSYLRVLTGPRQIFKKTAKLFLRKFCAKSAVVQNSPLKFARAHQESGIQLLRMPLTWWRAAARETHTRRKYIIIPNSNGASSLLLYFKEAADCD